MAFLVVLRGGRPLLRFRLDKEETTVGRGSEVDVYIPDARISRLHCIVRQELDGYRLIDRSSNGTLLNGVRTRAARLRDQDIITAGACQIQLELADQEEPVTTLRVPPEGGQVAYDQVRERLYYARPVLMVREGEAEPVRVPIPWEVARIGSAPGSDVLVSRAPAQLCELLHTEDGYTLRHLAPDQAAWVDDQPVRQDRPVPYGSVVRVGPTRMQLLLEEGEERLPPLAVSQYEGMVGTTPAMHRVFAQIDRFARHDAPVIVLGETGTGKELVARALHRRGHRAGGPFVAINCSAVSPQLFESELFGHARGAFTGAVRDRVGLIEAADRGTLFLDELGDMPLELQARLLRVLETSSVTPVGTHVSRPVNVRIVAATHKDLQRQVEEGRFRQDLFYRLFVLTIELPPLRERLEDLPALTRHFLGQLGPPREPPTLSRTAFLRLQRHHWPGNVRELRHALTRAAASAPEGQITEDALAFLGSQPAPTVDWGEADVREGLSRDGGPVERLEAMERKAMVSALQRCGGNRKEAAKLLGIARSTLHVRMKKYGLGGDEGREV